MRHEVDDDSLLFAFYRADAPGHQLIDTLIDWSTHRDGYSHVETLVPSRVKHTYSSFSSSPRDGGTRIKDGIDFDDLRTWDLVLMRVRTGDARRAYARAEHLDLPENRRPYDFAGVLRFVIPTSRRLSRHKMFCSDSAVDLAQHAGALLHVPAVQVYPAELKFIAEGRL